MLELLSGKMIYFSSDGVCLKITQDTVTEETQLSSSNQEEADTKHANHVLHENKNKNVVLRSPSGDVFLIFYVWQCFLCKLKKCGWTMELVIIILSLS